MGGDHLPPRPLVIAGFNQVRGRPHSKWDIVKQFNHLYSNGYSGRLWWLYREVNLLPSRSIHFGRIINFFQYYKSKNGKHGKNPKIYKFLGTFLYFFFLVLGGWTWQMNAQGPDTDDWITQAKGISSLSGKYGVTAGPFGALSSPLGSLIPKNLTLPANPVGK